MSAELRASLQAIARRHVRSADEADDVVQQALLAAIEAGRTDFSSGQGRAWLIGTVRNKARMLARGVVRQRAREEAWSEVAAAVNREGADRPDLARLPPSLRLTALLALNGATRSEIGWLLGLSDAALRQRVSQLKRAIEAGPVPDMGLQGALPFGAMRRKMVERLKKRGGFLASHDPDGHFFVLARSQKGGSRQQAGEHS